MTTRWAWWPISMAIDLTGGSVTTTGHQVRAQTYPHALVARNPNGVLNATDVTVLTTGDSAIGAVADDGGTMNLTRGSITTRGASSPGIYVTVEQAGAQFAATLTGSDLSVQTEGTNAHGAMANQNN